MQGKSGVSDRYVQKADDSNSLLQFLLSSCCSILQIYIPSYPVGASAYLGVGASKCSAAGPELGFAYSEKRAMVLIIREHTLIPVTSIMCCAASSSIPIIVKSDVLAQEESYSC